MRKTVKEMGEKNISPWEGCFHSLQIDRDGDALEPPIKCQKRAGLCEVLKQPYKTHAMF